jgi:dTDP-4-dehydrorhamnose 3,5-epimerase
MHPNRQPTRRLTPIDPAAELPHGVVLRPLDTHRDQRGMVAEFFRSDWRSVIAPPQWTMFTSAAHVMRGVHVHPQHDDYFVLISGVMYVGLRDLRPGSPTEHRVAMVHLRGDIPSALFIPHGVAHGMLSKTVSVFVIGASHHYDRADELGCHWRDPDLGIAWPMRSAQLSARDAAMPALAALRGRIPPWQP